MQQTQEQARVLTRDELSMLENKPMTKQQKILDRLIRLLPLLCGCLCLLEYFILPDVAVNRNEWTYVIFIGALMAAYLVALVVSLLRRKPVSKMRYMAPCYSAIALVLMMYDIFTLKSGILPMPYFPWINQILNAMISDAAYLAECSLSTLRLLMSGYFCGAALGLVTGIACGYSKKINYWISPIMKFLGPIPSTTWIPLVMVLASSLFGGSVFIIALGVWYAVTLASLTGISNVERSYFEAARTLGAKKTQLVFRVAIPYAIPSIFQGLTQGMSTACTALLVAEMIGTESGLGWYINWQKSWAQFGKMYAAIVLICLIFTLITYILQVIRRACTRWQKGVTQA